MDASLETVLRCIIPLFCLQGHWILSCVGTDTCGQARGRCVLCPTSSKPPEAAAGSHSGAGTESRLGTSVSGWAGERQEGGVPGHHSPRRPWTPPSRTSPASTEVWRSPCTLRSFLSLTRLACLDWSLAGPEPLRCTLQSVPTPLCFQQHDQACCRVLAKQPLPSRAVIKSLPALSS